MSKSVLVFFGLATLLLTGLVLAGVWYYLAKGNQAAEQLVDFIRSHPETTAVVAYTVDAAGNRDSKGICASIGVNCGWSIYFD